MNGQIIFWQIIAAYVLALIGGMVSVAFRLSHQTLCGLISLAAGTLFGVTLFVLIPEALQMSAWWLVIAAGTTGYFLFLVISKYVHHVCPACAASHFDADASRHFSDIAVALILSLAIHSTTNGLAVGIQQEATATDATKWSLFSEHSKHQVSEYNAHWTILD